jgi:hypothetical protein
MLFYYKRENTKNIEKNSNNNRKIMAKVLRIDTLSLLFTCFLVCFLYMTSFFQKSWKITLKFSFEESKPWLTLTQKTLLFGQ